MLELPQKIFDLYALALPRGLGFGDRVPVEAWLTEDSRALGIVRKDLTDQTFASLVMRRREDDVFTITHDMAGHGDQATARTVAQREIRDGDAPEPVPSGTPRRPALHDLQGRQPGDVFSLLYREPHHVAAYVLNQLYLSLPKPDPNWASDCQTVNFHTRIWEAHLLASFREQGLLVEQDQTNPDFRISNRRGEEAWVEAVTANPAVPYAHVNSPNSSPPGNLEERVFGPAAVRFAKTLGNKLQRQYERLGHVAGKPFVIALADFQAPASMVWSREALIGYLYGLSAECSEIEGAVVARPRYRTHLLGSSEFKAGLFGDDQCAQLSAVIFTNTCAISKFNRVGVSAGIPAKRRYVRIGEFFDRTEGATRGIPFCLDVESDAYRSLWPQAYEPWTADMEVFHNPFARNPLPKDLVPEATHWFDQDGELVCASYYETSILSSQTLILDRDAPIPTLNSLEA